jgi:hypothetical protein
LVVEELARKFHQLQTEQMAEIHQFLEHPHFQLLPQRVVAVAHHPVEQRVLPVVLVAVARHTRVQVQVELAILPQQLLAKVMLAEQDFWVLVVAVAVEVAQVK